VAQLVTNRCHTPITGDSVNRIVNKLGAKSGLKRKVRAHGLRHQGVTRADLTNGNVRMVQGLSRHADPRTLLRYDDSRRHDAGTLDQMLGNDSK
jgi:integrase/recombinase XerC